MLILPKISPVQCNVWESPLIGDSKQKNSLSQGLLLDLNLENGTDDASSEVVYAYTICSSLTPMNADSTQFRLIVQSHVAMKLTKRSMMLRVASTMFCNPIIELGSVLLVDY
jgi:hypothetical protein